jgi:predicted ATPase
LKGTIVAAHPTSQTTFFVGRDTELNDIAGLINDPHCRLLTLVGPGGIGKTRLAIEVARQQNSTFPDGSRFVSLQHLHSHEFIVSEMVQGLEFPFSPNSSLLGQLLDHLRKKSLLLVLDNFEQILEGSYLLSDILAHAPQVKILTTSRERLNLVEEWVYEVGGLSFPSSELETEIEIYSAVQLFMQHARRLNRNFTSTPTYKSAISRICRLVGGMPLGIDLASAWVRVLPCEVIADEIQHSLDILETTTRNTTARHRSMRAAFEPTWNRLSDEERDTFMKLSVFRGSFTREAAEYVAGAALRSLSALVDKSLLRLVTNGRFSIHELLRQYGEEHLNAAPYLHEQSLDLHCRYYMGMLAVCHKMIVFLGQQKEACERIEQELENVRMAWRRSIQHGHFDEMNTAIEGLWSFY